MEADFRPDCCQAPGLRLPMYWGKRRMAAMINAQVSSAGATGEPVPSAIAMPRSVQAATSMWLLTRPVWAISFSRGPAAAISVADIVEAVEGPIAMAPCSDHGRHDCTLEAACSIRPHWPAVDAALRGALAGISLTQLSRPAGIAAPVAEVMA